MYEEMKAQVTARINAILDSLPDDKVTEKYEASALRDYTQTLININRLINEDYTQTLINTNRLIDDSRKGDKSWRA